MKRIKDVGRYLGIIIIAILILIIMRKISRIRYRKKVKNVDITRFY